MTEEPDLCARLRAFHSKIMNEAAAEIDRLQEAKRRALAVADERAKEAVELRAALKELHAMVMGECPSLLDEDSGGDSRLDADIHALLYPVGAVQKP